MRLIGPDNSHAPGGTSGQTLAALPPSTPCSAQKPLFSGMCVAGDMSGLEGSLGGRERNTPIGYLGLSSETRTLAGTGLPVADNHGHNKPDRGNHRNS